jgi:hypothetical protein
VRGQAMPLVQEEANGGAAAAIDGRGRRGLGRQAQERPSPAESTCHSTA